MEESYRSLKEWMLWYLECGSGHSGGEGNCCWGVVELVVVVMLEAVVTFLEMEDETEQLLTIFLIETESARIKARDDKDAENWALELLDCS